MAVRKVSYVVLMVPNRAGTASRVLEAMAEGGVNLLAFTGFPASGGKSQLDLVTDNLAAVRRVAKQHGWKLGSNKRGFLAQGRDRIGGVFREIRGLARHGVNMIAVDAVAAGKGRFGMIFWVKEKDYARAAKVLKAK